MPAATFRNCQIKKKKKKKHFNESVIMVARHPIELKSQIIIHTSYSFPAMLRFSTNFIAVLPFPAPSDTLAIYPARVCTYLLILTSIFCTAILYRGLYDSRFSIRLAMVNFIFSVLSGTTMHYSYCTHYCLL